MATQFWQIANWQFEVPYGWYAWRVGKYFEARKAANAMAKMNPVKSASKWRREVYEYDDEASKFDAVECALWVPEESQDLGLTAALGGLDVFVFHAENPGPALPSAYLSRFEAQVFDPPQNDFELVSRRLDTAEFGDRTLIRDTQVRRNAGRQNPEDHFTSLGDRKAPEDPNSIGKEYVNCRIYIFIKDCVDVLVLNGEAFEPELLDHLVDNVVTPVAANMPIQLEPWTGRMSNAK